MKKILLIVLLMGLLINGYGQINVLEGKYTTFDNKVVDVYQIVGKYVVLNIGKTVITADQLNDKVTLEKILKRSDELYAFYKDNLGFEPAGGNIEFGNKVNVYFGQPSCGAGCGLVGYKGIEVAYFPDMYNKFKNNLLNVNPDRIISYEFGRNFFTFSSKIGFPYRPNTEDRNGGFAEGFANLFYTYAYNEILKEPEERMFNEELRYLLYSEEIFLGYINDTLATPYNFLAKWDGKQHITDPNRRINEPAYTAFGILHGTIKTFGKDKIFPKLFLELNQAPNATTIEDALSNLAYTISKSLNSNLLGYFENVLKFKLNSATKEKIKAMPPMQSKLIKCEDVLWFISPFDKIRMNLRSTNYLNDGYKYRLSTENKIISISTSGNFNLDYSILNGKNEIELTCELLDTNLQVIDSFKTLLKKRHNFNPLDYPQLMSNSYQAANLSFSKLVNKELITENQTSQFDNSIVSFWFIAPKNRTIEWGSDILHKQRTDFDKNSWISILAGNGFYSNGTGRVGLEPWYTDPTKYFSVKQVDLTDKFFKPESLNYEAIALNISQEGQGSPISFVKNIYIKDITDTDNDGFIDFEDNCPSEPGIYHGCPQIQTSTNQLIDSGFTFYPNPTNDKLRISSDTEGVVLILDLMGRLLVERKMNNSDQEIDVSKFISGTYILQFSSKDKIQTSKFIKN